MTAMLKRAADMIDGVAPIEMMGLMDVHASAHAEEVGPGVACIESFSNVVACDTGGEGLVLFDVSHQLFAPGAIDKLRGWSSAPVHTAVLTHGHIDHVTGAAAFEAEAAPRQIRFVAHANVEARFDRYKKTGGYNGIINQRQFRLPEPRWPSEFRTPDLSYQSSLLLEVGGARFDLHHARGETDDHTWAWLPQAKAVVVGDLFIWQFPNAGNPQKAQRYAWDWAVALREMMKLQPELLLPAHGPPIGGQDRIAHVLGDTARALESLHEQVLAMMNAGARLNDVIHTVRLPDELAHRPWLKATYDEPEFVVRNLWRLYGGWYDGNPASLKPARDTDLAKELANLAGGAEVLARRAERLAGDGELRLACHLAEMAALAAPDAPMVHAVRATVFELRRDAESSFMATGIFGAAAADSRAKADGS